MKQPIPLHKGHVPFARFLMALVAGIAVSYVYVPNRSLYLIVCGVLISSVITFASLILLTRLRRQRYYGAMGFLVFAALFATGAVLTWQTHPEIDQQHFSHGRYRALIGSIADEPVVRSGYIRFPLEISLAYGADTLTDVRGKLMLTVTMHDSLSQSFNYGDELVIPATYDDVPPPYNPSEMDYQRYLANKNCWHRAYLSSNEVQRIGTGKGSWLMAYALMLRRQLVGKFEQYLLDKDALSVASTLILGYRADLSDELLQAFSNTGTIHVLSVSGMHVVIVFWMFSRLLGWMNHGRKLRVGKFTILVTAVWSYAALTGFSPSVLRAATMITFVIAASTFSQQNRIYNSISASAFFLLLYNPKFIVDIGFQLSYLAVLGIVFLMPIWKAAFQTDYRLIKPISDYIGMSVSAQTSAGPLAAYYFHQFPLYFLLANLFIVLPASGIMYIGFILLILPSGIVASVAGEILERLILIVKSGLHYIEQLPGATIRGICLTGWDCLLIYMCLFAGAMAAVNRSKQWFYAAFMFVCMLVVFSFIANFQKLNRHEAIIFNVRQKLSIGLMDGGEAWVYSDLGSLDDRTMRYAVLPELEAYTSADKIHFVPSDSSYRSDRIYIKDQILQFGNLRLMVYDGEKTYGGKFETDILLIRNNPSISLTELVKNIRCKQLVVDGSNYSSTINRLLSEAKIAAIPIYVLKDNFAYRYRITD